MPVTVGVMAAEGKMVLVAWNKYIGRYRPVTGFIQYGEHPEMSAIRELVEETGYKGEIEKPLGVYVVGKKSANIVIIYQCKIIDRKGTGTDKCRWTSLDDLVAIEKDPGFIKMYKDYAQIL